MDVGEFVLTFVSVILGLAVTTQLSNFHALLVARRRVTWRVLPLVFALGMTFLTISLWWWSFEWFARIDSVTIGQFLPKFVYLSLTYLLIALSLPSTIPAEGLDLAKHFDDTHLERWGLFSLIQVITIVTYLAEGRGNELGYVGVNTALVVSALFVRSHLWQGLVMAWFFSSAMWFALPVRAV